MNLETILKDSRNQTDAMCKFMAVLGSCLEKKGRDLPIIVGGSAVEAYTGGQYCSGDIDIISSYDAVDILQEMNFENRGRSLYYSEKYDILIDWLGGTLGEGPAAHERTVYVETEFGKIRIISPCDLVIDRLQAFEHWKDGTSGEWAKVLIELIKLEKLPGDMRLLSDLIQKSDLSPNILRQLDDYMSDDSGSKQCLSQ